MKLHSDKPAVRSKVELDKPYDCSLSLKSHLT